MLKDLHDLATLASTEIDKNLYSIEELKFSDKFISDYNSNVDSRTIFHEHTAIMYTSTKTVVAPSLWFYASTFLTEFLGELLKYKKYAEDAFFYNGLPRMDSVFEKWTYNLAKGSEEIQDDFISNCKALYDDHDTDKLCKFLTNYKYWGGGKAIGRTQNDFSHSALLKASGLLNETSGYVSVITHILYNNPELKAELVNCIKPKIEMVSDGADFDFTIFNKTSEESGLIFSDKLISRYVSSLCTKPFVLLSGLSGSGKTKLAQSFAQWICKGKEQYCIVPVGADWTNREPLLGYPNALKSEEYVNPDNGILNLIIAADKNRNEPYFLILDEMNLSHVERYFADFLSAMESGDAIPLHPDKAGKKDTEGKIIPHEIKLNKNLFIVGTVNIDETTYMFSPKVLDRANAIEFRVDAEDIAAYLKAPRKIDLEKLEGTGAGMAESFVKLSQKEFDDKPNEELNKELIRFFNELKKSGAEFGYRTAGEIHCLCNQLGVINNDLELNEKIDIAIMQKLLPKLHGSQRKLKSVLSTLGSFCLVDGVDIQKDIFDSKIEINFKTDSRIKYRLSLEKIARMYKGSVENGFASYAEA